MALYTVIYNEQKPLYMHTLYYICRLESYILILLSLQIHLCIPSL